MLADVRRILIGAPLHSARITHECLSKIQALAVFSSDALSSVAYATEEILLVLVAAGSAALGLSLPIALVIVALLVVLDSPYRSTIEPLLTHLDETDQREPDRGLAVVVFPEFVPARWWHHLLHNQTAQLLKRVLLYRQRRTGKDRVIIDVPYHLQR